jgi:hypothetical protein
VIDSVFEPNAAGRPRAAAPERMTLSAHPNPLNSMTTISYTLPAPGQTILRLFDILGREVQALDLGDQGIGDHKTSLKFDALASGVYFAELSQAQMTVRTKIMLLK